METLTLIEPHEGRCLDVPMQLVHDNTDCEEQGDACEAHQNNSSTYKAEKSERGKPEHLNG